MGNKGIYTALSGAIAQSQRLDTIANNIANVNTTAFKKDQNAFREYLTANEKVPDVIQVPKVPATIESFYDMQSGDRGYVDNVGTFTDFTQGHLKKTGRDLDVSIEGNGFFEVLTSSGVKLTRNGSFRINSDNLLVTGEGNPVLARGNGNPANRTIKILGGKVTFSSSGEVLDSEGSAGSLSIMKVGNLDALKKVGNSNYSIKDNLDPQILAADEFKIHQGFLEGSNINIIQEMTDMISANRIFESTQKAIKAFDSMNEKLVNEVPKT